MGLHGWTAQTQWLEAFAQHGVHSTLPCSSMYKGAQNSVHLVFLPSGGSDKLVIQTLGCLGGYLDPRMWRSTLYLMANNRYELEAFEGLGA
jgi:hypothetical protein